jgi:peptidylprolyl isomerase
MSIEKPEVDFPGGEPPTELEISDIWPGDGAVAKMPYEGGPPRRQS